MNQVKLSGEMGGLIKIETITPAMARGLLERDSRNRPLRSSIVKRYAEEMASDKWQLNGETIKIAINGDVLDGQHRLNACIEAQTSFQTIVVYDLPSESFATIDSGKSRSLSDLLNIKNVPYATAIAGAAPYVYNWDHAATGKTVKSKLTGGIYRPSRNELFRWLEQTNWKIWPNSGHEARRVRDICPRSIATAAHYIMARTNERAAEDFYDKFATGAGFATENDPVLRLRSKLIKDRARIIQSPPQERFIWILTAWLAFLKDQPLTKLRPAFDLGLLRENIAKAAEHANPTN